MAAGLRAISGVPQPASRSPQRVVAILNPSKKNWLRARDLIAEQAAALNWPRPEFVTTTVADAGGGQARQALDSGAELVLVAGGDGTVREVALHLLDTGVPLGIVPVGTANLYSRNLSLRPRHLPRNVATAFTGAVAALDAGLARFRTADAGWSEDHLFLVLAGIGHDAATVIDTRAVLKKRLGWLAYFESGARHVARRPLQMTIQVDDGPARDTLAWSVIAGNCGRIPGGIVLFPAARIDDGLLDSMEVTVSHPGHWVAIGAKGLLRLNRDVPRLAYGQAQRLVLTPARPQPIQLDGDAFADVVELDLRLATRALRVKVPTPDDPEER